MTSLDHPTLLLTRAVTRSAPRKPVTTGCIIAATLWVALFCHEAHAYTYHAYCGGTPAQLDVRPLYLRRNSFSIPDNTSQADCYFHAVRSWNDVAGMPVIAATPSTGSTIQLDDWNSDVFLVDRSTINGWNGVTTYAHYNTCWLAGDQNYSASDVRIANDLDFRLRGPSEAYSSSKTALGAGRATFVHELGHQLGLGHENSAMNIMNDGQNTRRPSSPIGPVPFPDDIHGASSLYSYPARDNLFVSGQSWDGTRVIDNHEADETICWRDSLSLPVTIVNQGPEWRWFQVKFDFDNVDVSGLSFSFPTTRNAGPYSYNSFVWSQPTRLLVPGTYHITVTADADNRISETREDDNTMRHTGKLIVSDCTGIIPFVARTLLFL